MTASVHRHGQVPYHLSHRPPRRPGSYRDSALTCLAGPHLLRGPGAGPHHSQLLQSVLGLAGRQGGADGWTIPGASPDPCPPGGSTRGPSPGAHAHLGLHVGRVLQGTHRLDTHGVARLGQRQPALGTDGAGAWRSSPVRTPRAPAAPHASPPTPTSSTRPFSTARFVSSSSRSPSSCRISASSSARGSSAAMSGPSHPRLRWS